jgi:hypothetical protein
MADKVDKAFQRKDLARRIDFLATIVKNCDLEEQTIHYLNEKVTDIFKETVVNDPIFKHQSKVG